MATLDADDLAAIQSLLAANNPDISAQIAYDIQIENNDWGTAADKLVDDVWDEPLTGATHNVATSAGRRLRQLGDTVILKDGDTVAADNAGVINGSNGLGRIKLQPDVGTVCIGQAIRVTGMVRFIEAYDADTQYATVDAPWCTIPEVGDEYTIFNLRTSLIQRITSAASGTIAFVIAKLWDMIEDVSGYRFTSKAVEAVVASVLPTRGVIPVRVDQTFLTAFIGETITQSVSVYEEDGTTPVDLSGKTLQVCFESTATTDVAVIENANITVSGDDNNVVSFAYPSAVTGSVANYHWSLRDASAPKTVWQYGTLYVKRAALKDA